MKRGKKYVEAAKAVDRATLYDAPEAISLVKKAAVAKFDETIEVHIRTGCDGRHADQQIRGAVVLPHGTGKKVRVLVFAKDAKAVDRATLYDTNEAISLVKKAAVAKFDETIEVHIRTGCDGRHADQQIRGAVVLPHGTGKTVRVLVFAKDAKAEEAKAAGADFVGAEDLIPKIQNEGWLDFDVVVATPDMMGVVGRLGRVLGPKGLMPNPKAGTVTMDVTKAINDIKAGKIEYRLDKSNIIHVPIGKASFTEEQLSDNFQTLIGAIVKARPSTLKGQYLKSVVIAPTMGPGVKINPIKLA